jgi:hypothetical protein
MLKQLLCKLIKGHNKRLLYEREWSGLQSNIKGFNSHSAWICIDCDKTGISPVVIPRKYNKQCMVKGHMKHVLGVHAFYHESGYKLRTATRWCPICKIFYVELLSKTDYRRKWVECEVVTTNKL